MEEGQQGYSPSLSVTTCHTMLDAPDAALEMDTNVDSVKDRGVGFFHDVLFHNGRDMGYRTHAGILSLLQKQFRVHKAARGRRTRWQRRAGPA